VRGQRVLESAREEHRPPTPAVVAPELEVVLLARHARHDVGDPAPGVEADVQETELTLVRPEGEEAQDRPEKITPAVCHRLEISAAWAVRVEAARDDEAAGPALPWAEAARSCDEASPRDSAAILGFSLEHLIRPQQQRLRNREAESFGGLEVDDQFELGRLLDRKVARLGTLENLVDICGGSAE